MPFSTGMAITFSLIAAKMYRKNREFVLWPRIDQKTCFKSILTAGLKPIVIENKIEGDQIETNMNLLQNRLNEIGKEKVLAVVSTTSCFAPRARDNVIEIALFCKENNLVHIVNNAYGLQCDVTCKEIKKAITRGRIDSIVMSTDKNFMVPVGGSIIASPSLIFIDNILECYPGRASSTAVIDLFITYLSMGLKEYELLRSKRNSYFDYLKNELKKVAAEYGENVLCTKRNAISIAMTLSQFDNKNSKNIEPSSIGSMLYNCFCFGSRVISKNTTKTISGFKFNGYGSHSKRYPTSYLTCAVGIGCKKHEIDEFIKRLRKCLSNALLKNK